MRETFAEQRDKQSLVGRLVLNYRDNMNAKDPETGEFKKDQYIGKVESYNERTEEYDIRYKDGRLERWMHQEIDEGLLPLGLKYDNDGDSDGEGRPLQPSEDESDSAPEAQPETSGKKKATKGQLPASPSAEAQKAGRAKGRSLPAKKPAPKRSGRSAAAADAAAPSSDGGGDDAENRGGNDGEEIVDLMSSGSEEEESDSESDVPSACKGTLPPGFSSSDDESDGDSDAAGRRRDSKRLRPEQPTRTLPSRSGRPNGKEAPGSSGKGASGQGGRRRGHGLPGGGAPCGQSAGSRGDGRGARYRRWRRRHTGAVGVSWGPGSSWPAQMRQAESRRGEQAGPRQQQMLARLFC